jgi:hypothetical protein
MLLPLGVDGAAGTRLAEGLAFDHPHVQAVDPLDTGNLVLIALRRPLREQVVPLGQVRVRVDHTDTLGQLHHRVLPGGAHPRALASP